MIRADFSGDSYTGIPETERSIPLKGTTQKLVGSCNKLDTPVSDDRLPDNAEPQVTDRISINQQVFESMLIV
jgi:hypothetical protein